GELLGGRWRVQNLGGDGAVLQPDHFGAVGQQLADIDDYAGTGFVAGFLAARDELVVEDYLVAELGLGFRVADVVRLDKLRRAKITLKASVFDLAALGPVAGDAAAADRAPPAGRHQGGSSRDRQAPGGRRRSSAVGVRPARAGWRRFVCRGVPGFAGSSARCATRI